MIIQKHTQGVPVFYTGIAVFFFGFFSLIIAIMVSGCGATNECSGLFCSSDYTEETLASAATAPSDDEDAVSFDLTVKASGITVTTGGVDVCLDSECIQIDQTVSFNSIDADTFTANTAAYPVGFNSGTLYLAVSLNINDTPIAETITWPTSSSKSESRTFLVGQSCAEDNPTACEDVYYSSNLAMEFLDKPTYPATAQLEVSMQSIKVDTGLTSAFDMSALTGTVSVVTGGSTIANTTDFAGQFDATANSLTMDFPVSADGIYVGQINALANSISVIASLSQYLALDYVNASLTAEIVEFYAAMSIGTTQTASRSFQVTADLSALYSLTNTAIVESWTGSIEHTIYANIDGVPTNVTDFYLTNNFVSISNASSTQFIVDIIIPRAESRSVTLILEGTTTLTDSAESASTCYKYISLSAGADLSAAKQIGMVAQISDQNNLPADLTAGYNLAKAYPVLTGETKAQVAEAISAGTRQPLDSDVQKVDDNHVITAHLSTAHLASADRVLYVLEKRNDTDQLESRRAILATIPTFPFRGISRNVWALSLRAQTGAADAEKLANEVAAADDLIFTLGVDSLF